MLCPTRTTCNIICSRVTHYMIIAKHKQIGWANNIKLYIQFNYIYAYTHQRNSILWFHTIRPPPCYPCSTSLDSNLKIPFVVSTYKPQLVEHVPETCYGSHSVTLGEVPNTNIVRNAPRLPTRQPNTEEDNLSGPIRTSHNLHTHTDNTRQPEPQLKSSLCSSAIPSYNSKDVIPTHNSRNATCLPNIPSHNSRDTIPSHNSRNATTKFILKVSPKAS